MENTIKLLITEDPAEFSREQSSVLTQFGMVADYAGKDGIEVLEKIDSLKPDVVLMDMFMTRIDGIGVLRTVNRNKTEKKPLFIMFSTFDSPVLEREVMNNGASYFVLKPYNIADLAESIVRMINSNNEPVQAQYKGLCNINTTNSMELRVTEILHQIGVPAHIKGYNYLRDSIMMSVETPDIINAVTKRLYPSVAKKYETTSSRVERAIRHAIEVAWDRGDVDVLNSYFGYTIHNDRGKPTNSEFIAMISDKLRLQLKNAS
ncbi:MAG TPA: sporulation transcription factor Spo0A [Clostridiales bacterium]|nr:sporulation transcription factor Spo0A [Clostridiales bacterium]